MIRFLLISMFLISSCTFLSAKQLSTADEIRLELSNKDLKSSNEKNIFSNIIPASKLSKYETVKYMGIQIEKRDFLYDRVYEYFIRFLNKFILFLGVLIPIFFIMYLTPMFLYFAKNKNVKNSRGEKAINIGIMLLLSFCVLFLFYILYFYSNVLLISFSKIVSNISEIFAVFIFIIVLAPLLVLVLVFEISNSKMTFYPEGTIKDVILELVNYHAKSLGISVEIDTALFFMIFKLVLFFIVLNNINLVVNYLFLKYSNRMRIIIKLLFILGFISSLFYFNFELIQKLGLLFFELGSIVLRV